MFLSISQKAPSQKANIRNLPKINNQITSPEVRLIDSKGEMVGVMQTQKALAIARQSGLDLIEIAPNASPPLCKIMAIGQYRYEKQKQAKSNSKGKRKTKEIKFTINIGDHDREFKLNHGKQFLEEGHMLRCIVQMRGRELAHKQAGIDMMHKLLEQLKKNGKLHSAPSFTSNQVIAILMPIGGETAIGKKEEEVK